MASFVRGRAGRSVKSRKQAVAIALSEAGASNEQTPKRERRASPSYEGRRNVISPRNGEDGSRKENRTQPRASVR